MLYPAIYLRLDACLPYMPSHFIYDSSYSCFQAWDGKQIRWPARMKLRSRGSVLLSIFLFDFCPTFSFAIADMWGVLRKAKVTG